MCRRFTCEACVVVFCTLILHQLVECTHSRINICTRGTQYHSHTSFKNDKFALTPSVTKSRHWGRGEGRGYRDGNMTSRENMVSFHTPPSLSCWKCANMAKKKHWMHAGCSTPSTYAATHLGETRHSSSGQTLHMSHHFLHDFHASTTLTTRH